MPSDLHKCFAQVHKPIIDGNTRYSIQQLVIDHGGQISKALLEYKKVSDEHFWNLIDELENRFIENRIYFFSGLSSNICVKKQADERLIPVLIDFKRCGRRTFWYQPPLFFPYFFRLKMQRRFERIREQFKDCKKSES
jgi:hypothetical protein